MTRAQDIQELVREQAETPGERIRLERMAEALEETLRTEVPYRPEFRADLRAQLVAEARRTLVPWYRRPAVWGSSLAVAAAAAVLVLGLRFYSPVPVPAPGGNGQVAEDAEPEAERFKSFEYDTTPRLTSDLQIPLLQLPDEAADERVQPESLATLDVDKGAQIYLLQSAPDLDQFRRIAANLGLAGEPQQVEGGFWIGDGAKILTMSADGHVVYADQAAAAESGDVIDEDGARAAAHRFLDRAGLPVPDLQPLVIARTEDPPVRHFRVTYTPRVEGRPVVNARTEIWLTERSHVFRAEAYVHAREEAKGPRAVISRESAVALAEEGGGGRFGPEADLVYARSTAGGAVYLQPQWRVFGRNAQGARVVRYVPALAQ